MRERSPGHGSDSRVVRDYDQEEAGFESNGDVKVRDISKRRQDRGSAKNFRKNMNIYFLSNIFWLN